MRLNDFLVGALLAALAGAILIHVRGFPNIPGQNIGPAFFPRVLAVLLGACAVALMVRGWLGRSRQPWVEIAAWTRSPRHVASFAAAVVGVFLYYKLSEPVGFIPSGVVLLTVLFLSLRVPAARAIAFAVAATLVIHTIFYFLLRVPLPWGLLEPVHW